ncbi:hypothetical protein TNCV_2986471 [Trichonephila clavipes]|nr:hypothetical protein TNCV_2986471 [Trichonephila clavipes]
MSVFCVHPSTPPPTMEPNKGRQPAGHLTCVRHGTYLRGEPVLETAELITSRLTGAGSLLPPVYGEAWAKGHATGTPDSTFPRTYTETVFTIRSNYGKHARQISMFGCVTQRICCHLARLKDWNYNGFPPAGGQSMLIQTLLNKKECKRRR